MITDFFKATKKLGIGLAVGSALAMGASSAFAGGKAIYYEDDYSDLNVNAVKVAVEDISSKFHAKKLRALTLLVYGGNDELVGIAKRVAKRLHSEGIHIGVIEALDIDKIPETMGIGIYAGGARKADMLIYASVDPKVSENDIYTDAMAVYDHVFGDQKLSKKSPAPAGDKPALVNG